MAAVFGISRVLSRAKVICPEKEIRTLLTFGHLRRCMSSLVNVEKQGSIAILELNRKPVNSFSMEFLQEINSNLNELENDQDCQGLIITSGLPKVFSAGLDLVKEVYQPDVKRLASFWSCFQEMWLRLYGSRLATMAAINGHALAGGCVVGLACDYRVMAEEFRIGMIEIEAGLPPPFWVAGNMANVVGQSNAEQAILSNQRYSAEEALSIGLVDKVLPKDKVMEETKSEMEKWVMYSGRARELTKKIMRKQFIEALEDTREEDIKNFVDCILDEDVQKAIGMQIEKLSKK
ncbi:enoyl-CoA delta isomerase 1, mitochondrial-like [Orbicella faveolata]|uniref:enoyl-CoA delta isomerase 1, mitochondrial-like n=1 Tax=Orbicella faveolata TaxID=48498 RepID=UPI0009E20E19|nr:enoyl-CoA delta isomerase 1, mitochondrial-like [Orbicella faveolata]